MGNTSARGRQRRESANHTSSQFSISNLIGVSGENSGRSVNSVISIQSECGAQGHWSRSSRHRYNESINSRSLQSGKTSWPVTCKEVIFLPEFPVTTELSRNKFVVKETVAKGAYGQVYRVRKEEKDYALKVVSKSQVVSENAVRQVKEEARIQELCGHHQFIVGAVSRWQTKKHLYIVSEYVAGGELLSLLERCRRLPEELVRVYVAELALALDFLHNAGVIYRDLKPENILLDAAGHLQLIDFGLSKWLTRGARTFTICGTAKYMAPEIFSGEGYGHGVDWWSLGVVTCRMLTDEYPAPATHQSGVKTEEVHAALDGSEEESPRPGALPRGAQLSESARKLLWHLLEPEPQRRLRSLRELARTAFFMDFDFDHVRAMKISPRQILEKYFPSLDSPGDKAGCSDQLRAAATDVFSNFDHSAIL